MSKGIKSNLSGKRLENAGQNGVFTTANKAFVTPFRFQKTQLRLF
jgi:hypothetical protein